MESQTHPRRSQWRVLLRCLAMLRLLLRQPTSTHALRQIVIDEAESCGETLSMSAVNERFEKDRARLREILGCAIVHDHSQGVYHLVSIETPLLDLADLALRGLAFLQGNFSDPNTVMHDEITALIDQIVQLLPQERRRELMRYRQTLELDTAVLDRDTIAPEVWNAIQAGCAEKRLLEFSYRSRGREEAEIRHHVVEPSTYYLRDGHYYLDAYWLESRGVRTTAQGRWQQFRIGRILKAQVLAKHFTPRARRGQAELIYVLSPEVARGGVTPRFPETKIEHHDDGSATVRAKSNNLFTDLRVLLRYGHNCKVIGGDTAVAEMRKLVQSIYEVYARE